MLHRPSVDGQSDDRSRRKSSSLSPSARNMLGRTWNKVEHWLKKDTDGKRSRSNTLGRSQERPELPDVTDVLDEKDVVERPVIPSLPRALTFQRQNSEKRDRLYPCEPDPVERRAASVDRKAPATRVRTLSPPESPMHLSVSAPDVYSLYKTDEHSIEKFPEYRDDSQESLYPEHFDHGANSTVSLSDELERQQIHAELESKWILNLSMHFKDRSDREKFFLTYAEQPNKWRRVTVSCDYRNAEPDSLEADLKAIHYQRDKSARIYEAVRDSLPSIQFYATVTNLKIKTKDGRLHIHCSEDVNEIIKYPHATMLSPISCPRYRESDVMFRSHMSGFVYRVAVNGRVLVKKEIPGPEAVDEFLYEVNALAALRGSRNVISFEGLVLDDDDTSIKGLLISLAPQGALVDLIYDSRYGSGLSWAFRERWARQIVNGLSEIHEAGFVQGDFTLSNLVVDEDDNVFLIDVNRRGCPVGWEPPELDAMIKAGQRISMFIGVKTDLFQLGMVLWGLAMHIDEPEQESRPLSRMTDPDIPDYYHHIVESCLSTDPRERTSATELLKLFPPEIELSEHGQMEMQTKVLDREEKRYIDPDSAIGLDDIPTLSKDAVSLHAPSQLSEASYLTFADGTTSSDYMFDAGDSVMHTVEVIPVSSVEEPDLAKHINLGDPEVIVQLEPPEYFVSLSETHLQSPASELSSSTPTLLGPTFVPLPQSPPSEPVVVEALEEVKESIHQPSEPVVVEACEAVKETHRPTIMLPVEGTIMSDTDTLIDSQPMSIDSPTTKFPTDNLETSSSHID
jgi:serine/threonine protein kinase